MNDFLIIMMIVWAVIGAVVTPIVFKAKQQSIGLGIFLGIVSGALGGILILLPLWLITPNRNKQKKNMTPELSKEQNTMSNFSINYVTPIQNQISHAAEVTKWKADQQIRLLKSQNRVNEVENKIRVQKSILADKTLELYKQGTLSETDLNQICAIITNLHNEITEERKLQEAIRQESSPKRQALQVDSEEKTLIPQPIVKLCSKCNVPMNILEHQDKKFYVCPNYKQCKQVIPIENEPENHLPEQKAYAETYQSEQPMKSDTVPINISKKDKINIKNSSADSGKKKQSPLALGGGAILGSIIGCIASLILLSILLN